MWKGPLAFGAIVYESRQRIIHGPSSADFLYVNNSAEAYDASHCLVPLGENSTARVLSCCLAAHEWTTCAAA